LKRLLLIDGDEFLFRACAAVEKEVKFNVILGEVDWNEPPIHVLGSNPVQAREVLDEMIERIFERFETRNHAMCFSSPPNFRYGVDPTYKNNRANSRKPLCYVELREQVENAFKCRAFPGLEADDVMGVLATHPKTVRESQPIIISQDKDMQTIPTQVWRQGELMTISEEQADYYHLFQTLIGDTSDGYKGCPGVGKVKAEKLLSDALAEPRHTGDNVLWPVVVAAFEKAKLTEQDALTQARLARILRWSDWNNTKKEPILWTPS
jgi:DNA polymerase-1